MSATWCPPCCGLVLSVVGWSPDQPNHFAQEPFGGSGGTGRETRPQRRVRWDGSGDPPTTEGRVGRPAHNGGTGRETRPQRRDGSGDPPTTEGRVGRPAHNGGRPTHFAQEPFGGSGGTGRETRPQRRLPPPSPRCGLVSRPSHLVAPSRVSVVAAAAVPAEGRRRPAARRYRVRER